MKNILAKLLFCFIIIGFGCTPKQASNTSSTEEAQTESEPSDQATAEVETPTDQNYVITVLKADLPSPRKEMKGKIGNVDITVNFGSPSVKGRKIWGGLEPYGKVWRSGANEATTFDVSQEVTIEGEKLPAGKYGLFTIPKEEGDWVLIFNSVAEQWGAFDYDESKDVLRVNVTARPTDELIEALDYIIAGDAVVLRWEKMALPFKVAPE